MCGICGIYLFNHADHVDGELLRRMTHMQTHRGPNDSGFYCQGSVGLGMRRLSIIDLAGGHQPLQNEDETVWIVFNGEIYNFRELRAQLESAGHIFRTNSDTEIIVHAYEQWGVDALARLNGMFGFALWDQRKRRLLLARDPFGIKPLYVWQNQEMLLFASELKSFLANPLFFREIDPVALDSYLSFQFVPSPHTIFKNVQKLRPGHCMLIEDGQVCTLQFYNHVPRIRTSVDEATLIPELQAILASAVKRQMVSDVPVGALLSGGVDSAAVVAIMQQVTSHQVKTFTVGFEGKFAHNEILQARRSAVILGSEHHEIVVSAHDCLNAFDRVTWHMDEPVATSSTLAMYWLSQLASRYVTVVLTGQGVDEPWAGYRRYRGEKAGAWYRRMPLALRQKVIAPMIENLPRAESLKRAIYALGTIDPVQRFTDVYTVFTPAMKKALYRQEGWPDADTRDVAASIRYWQSQVGHLNPLAQQLYVETRLSLPDNLLLYGDKMSMAASLEVRVPLLDLDFMAFVESLPTNLRLRGWSGHKYLYRRAIARWLPSEILRRPKIGFETPIDVWFQREITGYVRERLLSPGSACRKYFNPGYIETLLQDHVALRKNYTRQIFTLLVFEQWHECFMAPVTVDRW